MPDSKPRKGESPRADGSPQRRLPFPTLLLVLAILLSTMVLSYMGGTPEDAVRYDEFLRWVRDDRVAWVQLTDTHVRGAYATDRKPPSKQGTQERPEHFVTGRVEDDGLVALLDERRIPFRSIPESGLSSQWPWLVYIGMSVVLMVMLFGGMSRRMGASPTGVLAFGKSRGKVFKEHEVSVSFKDVAGVDEAKVELREIIEFLKTPDKYRRLGAKIPKGVLLVGPPGTGKTLLARAVAGEAAVPFISISGSEFVEMFVGVGAARVRDLFEQAEKSAPCIVFIDELDALGRSRSGASSGPGSNEEREQTLNQLLVEMDGFSPREAVIIMAATNRPEILDPALLRPGRFDRQVLVDRPDRAGREQILRVHSRNVVVDATVDLAELAARTPGFAGADLANLVNEAALLAARRDRESVGMDDFSAAVDRVVAGLETKSRLITPDERRRVAYHEVGHALASVYGGGDDKIHKISIIPRGMGALGYTMQLPTEDRYLMTESAIAAKLVGLLGGRAAERLVFGEPSTGAHNDLQKATEIARAMVTEYGMSDAIGPVAVRTDRRSPFLQGLGGVGLSGRECGAQVTDLVDSEVRRIIEAAEQRALAILAEHRARLDRIATRLLEAEQLEGDELAALLAP